MLEFRIDKRGGVATYLQIVQQVKQALRLGVLVEGDRLPTAAQVAATTRVNPNTTLKAYRELEREGLVEPRPGQGTFVTGTLGRPRTESDAALRGELAAWLGRAREAGLDRDDVAALVSAEVDAAFADPGA